MRDIGKTMLKASELISHLMTSDNQEMHELAKVIGENRTKMIEVAKRSDSEKSPLYWAKHKLVADISSHWDFGVRILPSEDTERLLETDCIIKWVGDTREEVIELAEKYLTDRQNYTGEGLAWVDYFIENFLEKGLSDLKEGQNFFRWGGNNTIDIELHLSDNNLPEEKDRIPKMMIEGVAVSLLDDHELIELGFVENEAQNA